MVQSRTHLRTESNNYSVDLNNLEQGYKVELSSHAELRIVDNVFQVDVLILCMSPSNVEILVEKQFTSC